VDLVELIKLSLRRWYVVVPVLVLTGIVAYIVQQRAPAEYQASGSVMLATPDLNPAGLPRAIIDIDNALVELESDEGRAELAAEGAEAEFLLRRIDPSLIEVYVTSDVSATATDTATVIVNRLATHVTSRQEDGGVPPAEQIRPRTRVQELPRDGSAEAPIEVVGSLILDDPIASTRNPYGADAATGRLLQAAVESDAGRIRFAELAGPVAFDVGLGGRDAGGLLSITTIGPDPTAVLAGFEHAKTLLADELDTRQARADVPTTQRIVIDTLAEPQVVTDLTSSLDRAVVVVISLGGLLALALVLVIENLSGSAATRREFADLSSASAEGSGSWIDPSTDGYLTYPTVRSAPEEEGKVEEARWP
jgi:hypothetical protein